jgi:single-stranded-DNA-specific exonuclease
MKKEYRILSPDESIVRTLSGRLKCHPATATVLVNRGISTHEAASKFLSDSLKYLRSPQGVQDMDKAVRRIAAALDKKESILIFGDYDADGVTATALLVDFFNCIDARVRYYIPHRSKEGYGMDTHHIHRIAIPKKIDLIITVDCGSSSHEAVEAAREAGIDVIITDHHHTAPPLPSAVAVVNPNRPDCTAGFGLLAGVGVAYALLICLRKHLREHHFWPPGEEPNLKTLCDLVALGTVADIVPLRSDNRLLTKTGLQVINARSRVGISALGKAAGLTSRTFTAEDIAFRLAPRINAAGRIAHAACAVRLLTTRKEEKARRIAAMLGRLNDRRRHTEQEILSQVMAYIQATPSVLQRNSLVLKHPDWHEGVLGIVASKLVERFHRPAILISIRNGIGKGSARSIPGFHIFKGLGKTSNHLERFGGHAMAAGLQIQAERIDGFREAFEAVVTEGTCQEDFVPTIDIDRELTFDDITPKLADELETLQPFGPDNSEPVFMARNVSVVFSKIVGGRHRQLRLKSPGASSNTIFKAIQFNVDPDAPPPTFLERIAFRVQWNHWNGNKSIQLIVEAT